MLTEPDAAAMRRAFALPDDAETCAAPCVDEQVGFVPAIEADAEGGGFEKPVHLREGGFEPLRVVVVRNAAPGAVGVAGDVGRLGHDDSWSPPRVAEFNTFGGFA